MRKGSQVLSLVPHNQQEFTAEQKCIIEVPADIGFLKGRSSYLAVDVVNTSAGFQRWMFPGSAQCLIQQVDIFTGSGAGGLLLESLQNYNQWAAFEDQYIWNDQTPRHGKEAQRSPQDVLRCPGLRQAGVSVFPTCDPGDGTAAINGQMSPISESGQAKYVARRLCIPLKCGVFRWWDEERLTPVLAMTGLRIEITFAKNALVCQNLGALVAGTPTDTSGVGIAHPLYAPGAATTTLTGVKSIEASGLAVGNTVTFSVGGGGAGYTTAITAMGIDAVSGDVELTFAADAGGSAAGVCTLDNPGQVSYKVTKCELRAVQIVPPKALAAKPLSGVKYKFTTYHHFIDTVLTTSRRHVTEIPSVASRGKSMISLFTNVAVEELTTAPGYYQGVDPTGLSLTSVQYFLDNRAFPLRAYNPGARADRCITQNELVKAIGGCSKIVTSLGSSDVHDLDIYSQTFALGRELARGEDFSYDLRSAEPQIRLGFSGNRAFNTRVNSFVFSDVIVSVGGDGLQIDY
jgi:hypothetical protein